MAHSNFSNYANFPPSVTEPFLPLEHPERGNWSSLVWDRQSCSLCSQWPSNKLKVLFWKDINPLWRVQCKVFQLWTVYYLPYSKQTLNACGVFLCAYTFQLVWILFPLDLEHQALELPHPKNLSLCIAHSKCACFVQPGEKKKLIAFWHYFWSNDVHTH